jgi:acetyl-CoA C-acetyltransferase
VELQHGVSLASLAGLAARLHMRKFGTTREQLAKIAVKNHANGMDNPISHFKKRITVDTVLESPMIADPLRLYDFCPVSDGAAALVIGSKAAVAKISDTPVTFTGIGHGTDHVAIQYRDDVTGFLAIRQAAEEAFRRAKLERSDIDVAELHDAFTIIELGAYEEIGFVPKGEGGKAVDEGIFERGGKLPVNPSGGLKARGHPVGATGVAQVAEIVYQLRGEAGKRQVEGAEYGLTSNIGGFGNNVISFILQRG